MAKNKISAFDIERIQNLSYQDLGKSVVSGDYSLKELRQAYSQMRSTAQKRIERLNKPENIRQFGQPEKEFFTPTKNITTSSALLREIKDVSSFLNKKGSTISGLRERRSYLIEHMNESGWDVSKQDYPDLVKFIKWFKASEYSKKYDSDSPEVAEVFSSERATPEDWRKAFEALRGTERRTAPVREY